MRRYVSRRTIISPFHYFISAINVKACLSKNVLIIFARIYDEFIARIEALVKILLEHLRCPLSIDCREQQRERL